MKNEDKNEDKNDNEESKNISGLWGAENMYNRISKINFYNNIYYK